jgi:hypothetical protein
MRLCCLAFALATSFTESAAKLYSAIMPRHRQTNREIEVKLRVADVPGMLRKLENLGARYESRVLERNTLYDTPGSDFRRCGALLRIRAETPAPRSGYQSPTVAGRSVSRRTILTSKPQLRSGPHAIAATRKSSRGNWSSPALRLTGTASYDPWAFALAFATTRSGRPSVSAVFQVWPSSLTRLPPEPSSSSKAFLATSTAPLAPSATLLATITAAAIGTCTSPTAAAEASPREIWCSINKNKQNSRQTFTLRLTNFSYARNSSIGDKRKHHGRAFVELGTGK